MQLDRWTDGPCKKTSKKSVADEGQVAAASNEDGDRDDDRDDNGNIIIETVSVENESITGNSSLQPL